MLEFAGGLRPHIARPEVHRIPSETAFNQVLPGLNSPLLDKQSAVVTASVYLVPVSLCKFLSRFVAVQVQDPGLACWLCDSCRSHVNGV